MGILLTAMSVIGCSSGSSSSSGPTSTTATTATAASTSTTQAVAADKQAASAVVIQAADVGPGFTGTTHDTSTDDDLATCVNHDPVLSGLSYPTQAVGEDLTNSSELPSTDIQSSVRVAPNVEAATASMAAIKASGVLTCLTDLFKTSGQNGGVTVSGLILSPLAVPVIGDDVFAFKLVGTATQSGTTIHSTQYGLLVRKGRVLNQLSVDGLNVVPPLSLATQLATTMATRAAAIH
jgi:hypothetical protein